MSIPKLFGVSAEAAQSAEDALSLNLKVPQAPWPVNTSTDPRSGDQYHRWAEVAVIEKAFLEESKNGLTTFVVEGKIRTGMPNKNRKVFARHYMDFDAFSQGDAADAGRRSMNDRTIASLQSLLKATGFATADGAMPAELLSALFPAKEAGTTSPLSNKIVSINLCDSPNKGEGAKTPRRTQAESYNTAP